MSEEKEKYVEPIRSKLFMDILKIVKKLNLVKTDKDDYDHLSVTYELEKLFNDLEQQKAELLEFAKEMRDIGMLNPDRLPEYTDIIYHHANDLITRITGGERDE